MLAAVVGITVTVVVLMLLTGMGPHVLLVTALGLVLGFGVWLVAGLSTIAVGSDGVPSIMSDPPPGRADRRVTRLRSGLAYGRRDDGSLERLRESLIELIDDQLLAAHDVDRHGDRGAADVILGPELERFITDESTAQELAKPRHLAAILTLIEQI